MMYVLKRFVLMLQFFTIFPINISIDSDSKDFGKGLVFAPIIGIIIGVCLVIVLIFSKIILPIPLTAIVLVSAYVLITGGLHLDGLADTFDGVFSNRSRERMLEIMRDSRIGTNGVLALIVIMAFYFTGLYYLLNVEMKMEDLGKILIALPIAGRMGSLIGAGISNYARTSDGLGKSFIDFCGIKEIIIGSIAPLLVFFLLFGQIGLLLFLIPVFSSIIVTKFFNSKLGGATGDTLGATCELNQIIYLILTIVAINFNNKA